MGVNNNPPIVISPDLDKSSTASYINENFRKLSDGLNPFQVSNGTNNILNIGKDSSGEYTMKVAKPGHDAFNATDDQLIFNSNQNTFKVIDSVTGTFPEVIVTGPTGVDGYVSGTGSTSQAHGLSIKPAFVAFADFLGDGSRTNLPITITDVQDPGYFLQVTLSVRVDDTDITFIADVFAYLPASTPVSFEALTDVCKVYLLQETAN